MNSKSLFYCLQVGILYFLLSIEFVQSSKAHCELKCRKWDLICTKPSKSFTPRCPYVQCNPSDFIRYPKNANDVAKIVQEAMGKGLAVKSFGNQQGQTDLICTEGYPMGITALQSRQMNADGTATFGAGVNIFDVGEFLRVNGRALETFPIYGNITISGAIVTGEQGNSAKFDASIASLVVKITIINSKGEIQVISCPEELKAFSLSLGLLGILIDVTLRTVKLYKLTAHNYIERESILSNGKAIQWAEKTDELSLYWFPDCEEVVVSNRTRVCVDTPGNARSNDYLSTTYANFARIIRKSSEVAFSLTSNTCTKANAVGYQILNAIAFFIKSSLVEPTPGLAPIYTEDGSTVKNPAVGYPHLISSPICYNTPQGPNRAACPDSHGANSILTLDNEFSIKACDLPAFVKVVKDVLKKAPAAFIFGIRITFSGKSDLYLATSYGRESVNIEFRMLNRRDLFNEPSGSLAAYQTLIQILINKFKARSNWGKGGLAVHDSKSLDLKLEKCARDSFIGVLNKNDEKEVFVNKIGLRLKGKGTKIDANPLSNRCALLGSCFCTKDADCGATQTCTTLSGYTHSACKTKNEEPLSKADKGVLPPLRDLVEYLDVVVPQLASAVLSKCSDEL